MWQDLFVRYGTEQKTSEIKLSLYLRHPRTLSKTIDVQRADERAAQEIERLQQLIEDLQNYRVALTRRYGVLATMGYTVRLELQRYPISGKIKYYIRSVVTYDDGTEFKAFEEVFAGKERSKALARFKDLQKQSPGIVATMDIAKRSWER